MELLEVRGQEDGSKDNAAVTRASLETTTTKHIGFLTNDRNAAFNCRVLFIIQPTMSIKLQKKKKNQENKRPKAMTTEEQDVNFTATYSVPIVIVE